MIDENGTLYGTTTSTVFSISPSGSLTVLHIFGGGKKDGADPVAPLIDVRGTLYGTTVHGGEYCHENSFSVGCGTVFSIKPNGTETVLHSFGATGDGKNPIAGLIDVGGRLYGTTMGGVNLVVGFRPELWKEVVPDEAPAGVEGFNDDIVGIEGFTMPATQHDAVLWLAGSAYDVIFDISREAINELKGLATVADETSSWPYQHFRDLTGFVDGTENPSLVEAPGVVLIAEGSPGAAGSILLLQKWPHDSGKWEALPVAEQELVIGRRKADSEELDDKPKYAHAARTDQDEFGKIFRRNVAAVALRLKEAFAFRTLIACRLG